MFHHHLVMPMNKGFSDEGRSSVLLPPVSFTGEGRCKNRPFHRDFLFSFTLVKEEKKREAGPPVSPRHFTK
jgi:hypothetical protein